MMKKAILILAMTVALAGCLEKEVTQTLYLEADGSVTWEVLERNVYSSASKPDDRVREEREYFEDALAGRPSVLAALEEIGGTDLTSEFLRDTPPYSVRVTARFKDLGVALGALFQEADLDAEVRLEVEGERSVLTITPVDSGAESGSDEDNALMEDLFHSDGLRFVLAAGRFVESEAFAIVEGNRQAVWNSENPDEEPERLRLVWTVPQARD